MATASQTGGILGVARLVVLLSGGALAAMVQLAILPSLTQMAVHFSGQGGGALDSTSIAQLVMTVAAPTMAIGAPLMGWLGGLIGKRFVLLASALLYAVAGAIGAIAPDLWTLLASRLLLGLAAAGFGTMAIAFIGDEYIGEKRDRLIGWYSFLGSAGAFVGLLAAGWLADIGWRVPFGIYLIGLVLFAIALPSIRNTTLGTQAAEVAGGGSMRSATGLFVLIVAISMVVYMVSVQGPFLLAADGITNPSTQAVVVNITTLGSMLSAYLFGFLRPKLGFTLILSLTWAALGLGSLGFGLGGNLTMLCVFAGLSGFGSGFMAPLTQTAILNVVSAEVRTRAIGLGFGLIFLGQFVQPLVLAPLRSLVGIHGAFVWVGSLAFVIGVLTIVWGMRPAGKPRPA